MEGSSSLMGCVESRLGAIDGLDLVVANEVLEPLSDCFVETEPEKLESRDGGSESSGNLDTKGDWSREEGTDTTTGDETAVPAGLLGMEALFEGPLFLAVP